MQFIKLTGHQGQAIYINLDKIVSIVDGKVEPFKSTVRTQGGHTHYVNENVAYILSCLPVE